MRSINENAVNDFKGFNDVIVDETLLVENREVSGLCFVDSVVEATNKNRTPIMRIYVRCKQGGIIQCNYTTFIKVSTTSEDILALKNKVIFIKGMVTLFKNMVLVDLLDPPVIYTNTEITVDMFFKKSKTREMDFSNVTDILNWIAEDASLEKYVVNFKKTGILKSLRDNTVSKTLSFIGDHIKILLCILNIEKEMVDSVDKSILKELMFNTILLYTLETYFKHSLGKATSVIDNPLEITLKINKSVEKYDLANKRMISDILHTESCKYGLDKPVTLLSKTYLNLVESVEKVLFGAKMEVNVTRGNKICIMGEEHVSIK